MSDLTNKQKAISRTIGIEFAKAIMYPEKREHYEERGWLALTVVAAFTTHERKTAIHSAANHYRNLILADEGFTWSDQRGQWLTASH